MSSLFIRDLYGCFIHLSDFFYIIILSACFDFTCITYTQYDTLLIQSMKLWTEGTLSLQKTLAEEHCA